MRKQFKFYIPLKKGPGNDELLEGVASTTSLDKDDEMMSQLALQDMVKDIMSLGVNLFGNHEHDWENTLGVVTAGELVEKRLHVKIDLDDPTTNPKIPMMLNKLKRGINLGLSVGGEVMEDHVEYNKKLGKNVNIIDRVKLYEISVVGIGSNGDAFLAIPNQITKSLNNRSCPVCLAKGFRKRCRVCLYG